MKMLAGIFFILLSSVSQAQENPCTETYLDNAIRRGGTIALACPYPVEITSPKTITKDTFMIGMGLRPLIIDGTNEVNNIFYVTNGAQLSLHQVNVVDSTNFGVLLDEGSTLNVTDSLFSRHGSEKNNGAGIWNDGGTVSVSGSVFEFNENGAAIINEGTLEVTNSVFRDNRNKDEQGAAIQNHGTALIVGSTFYDNTVGAPVANLDGAMTLIDSWIYGNDTGIFNQAELHLGHSRVVDNRLGIQNKGTVYLSLTEVNNCAGDGAVVDRGGNYQGMAGETTEPTCGDTIPVTTEIPYELHLVTAFSAADITSDGTDTYSVSLYWSSYEVDTFRVVLEPLNRHEDPIITMIVKGGTDIYASALVPGLACGTEYTAYVEGLSPDERVVRGRSYKISVLTPGCG
ncbi:MAG: hypothetical protein KJ064_16625 [Anaerolineae bacterium]|nr:hypothetical protein [Anaerolineae bacterium]